MRKGISFSPLDGVQWSKGWELRFLYLPACSVGRDGEGRWASRGTWWQGQHVGTVGRMGCAGGAMGM